LRGLLDYPVLVLNLNYEPLNVCNVKRAITLIVVGKAEVLENSRGIIRTPSATFLCPSVIKLAYMIRRPRPRVTLNKKEIFRRDNYTCQYCGHQSKNLTVDHIIPRHHGGQYLWENLASACPACNHRKGGRSLQEANLQLLQHPHEPHATSSYLFGRYVKENREWQQFIEGW
jgi:5-methylcytosine-specific restriction endonuclease McrA